MKGVAAIHHLTVSHDPAHMENSKALGAFSSSFLSNIWGGGKLS